MNNYNNGAVEQAILNGCDGCSTCPFTIGEQSDQVQNHGCLPTNVEILELASRTGRAWECHGLSGKVCRGYASVAKQLGLPTLGELNTLETWMGTWMP